MEQTFPLGSLLVTVFNSILEVFLLCLAGYILAAKGILDKKTQKQLNKLNVSLFTPALLFSKVAFFLSPEKLRELWIIPIFFVIVTIVSMSVAYLLGTLFRLKKSQRAFAIAASMFMNSNSLPIALMQSLVITVPALKWAKGDNKNAMLGRALTYLVLYSTLGMVLRWSYGVRLLSQADDDEGEGRIALPQDDDERHGSDSPSSSSSTPTIPVIIVDHSAGNPRKPKYYNSFPNSPDQSRIPSDDEQESDTEDEGQTPQASPELPVHRSSKSSSQRHHTTIASRMKRILRGIRNFMTVPLYSALLSLIVALIQPLQHTLDVHLTPVKGALNSAGSVAVPITLVVLGGYFYDEKSGDKSLLDSVRDALKGQRTPRQNSDAQPGETKTVVVAILSRMILTPLVLFPLLASSAIHDWQSVFEDPVFVVSNVLLVASPPALTLAQITQATSGVSFERLISRTIFWSYCVLTPPLMVLVVIVGLWLAKL